MSAPVPELGDAGRAGADVVTVCGFLERGADTSAAQTSVKEPTRAACSS
jgi:hypothetical protein